MTSKMETVGQLDESTLICAPASATQITHVIENSIPESFVHHHQLFLLNINTDPSTRTSLGNRSSSQLNRNTPQPFITLPSPGSDPSTKISQVSCQPLRNTQIPDALPSQDITNYSLLTVTYHRHDSTSTEFGNDSLDNPAFFSAWLYLLREEQHAYGKDDEDTLKSGGRTLIEATLTAKVELIPEQKSKLNAHIMPCEKSAAESQVIKTFRKDMPPTPTPTGRTFPRTFTNRILALHLQESITIYKIETIIPATEGPSLSSSTIEILSSESVPKLFCWAQWNPAYQFLAFAHKQLGERGFRSLESSHSSYSSPMNRRKLVDMGILSVYQFHATYPRESVLNFPLPKYEEETLTRKQEFFKPSYQLAQNPFVLTPLPSSSTQPQLRILANASGIVYLFQLLPPSASLICTTAASAAERNKEVSVKYTVTILHHNKVLAGEIPAGGLNASLNVDVCLLMNGQFLAIVGWPLFVHILDVGADHEPSHHLVIDVSLLTFLLSPSTTTGTKSLASSTSTIAAAASAEVHQLPVPPTFGLSLAMASASENEPHQASCSLRLVFTNLQVQYLELNSSSLLSLMKISDTQFKLNALHFLLIHLNDANAVKRMIYDSCQSTSNVWLSKLFQEFIITNSFNQTRKQLLPNMKRFLHHLPYCPFTNAKDVYEGTHYKIELKTCTVQVSTMLLSPNQRIFPHTVTDLWTTLWELNGILTKNRRFSHKTIADKLLLSLQCYKPEVLSRASTPMSPSSPMIWSSATAALNINGGATIASGSNSSNSSLDMASPFGRRTPDIQLPFVEHESCTANKQEFIYSINLRELSMHLLKERKDCPVHGHSVGGKYVNALVDTSRLLCHLICLSANLQQPYKSRDKGFRLIDSLNWTTKLKLFILFEHYTLGMGTLACPLPNGFTSFFTYLGYRVLQFDQFLWHAKAGTFELQIDLVKTIMADMNDCDESNVEKKLHLISLLSKSRANRVLNGWSHPKSICIRARQHSSDLLNGSIISRRSHSHHSSNSASHSKRIKPKSDGESSNSNLEDEKGPLGTFFKLLTAKANASDINFALLTEATMVSMKLND